MATSQSPAVLARIANEKDLQCIAKSVGSNWEMLGTYLLKENPISKVDQIKEDHPKSQMRIYHLLLTWKAEAAPDTTLGHLFHQMLKVGTSVTIEWWTIAKNLGIDERDIRTCKDGYQPPLQESHTNQDQYRDEDSCQLQVQESHTNQDPFKDDNFNRKVLNRSFQKFLEDLDVEAVFVAFLKKDYLEYTQVRDIQGQRLTFREIIKMIGSKGVKGYKTFKDVLGEHFAELLDKKERILEREIQTTEKEKGGKDGEARAQQQQAIVQQPVAPEQTDDNFYKRVLNRSFQRFLEDLDPEAVLDSFLEKEYLNYTQVRDIQEQRLTSDKTREIIKKVGSKGVKGYKTFKEVLRESHQEHFAELLDKQERILTTEIQMAEKEKSEKDGQARAQQQQAINQQHVAPEQTDKIMEPEKSEDEKPTHQHAFKTRTEPNGSELNSWTYCLCHSDWENAEILLNQGKLPDKKQLKIACIKLGRKSDLIQKICKKICDHIVESTGGDFKAFPAVQSSKETDIIFVIIGKKENENETFDYNVLYQTGSTEMKAISEKRKLLANQRFVSPIERKRVKKCINTLNLDFFKQHKYLSLVESSPYRSKGFITDCHEGHELIEETCIVLGVTVKGYFPIDEDELPSNIGEFKTDVREITITKSTDGSPFDFHENIKMNCVISGAPRNINQCNIDYGTMGVFMSESCNRNEYCLGMTCAHVLFEGNEMRNMQQKQSMLKPTKMYCYQPIQGNNSSRQCGQVKYAVFSKDVDVVLFSPDETRFPRNGFPGNSTHSFNGHLWNADNCPNVYQTRVLKLPGGGVSDQITHGEILTDDAMIKDPFENGYDFLLRNQIHIQSDKGLFSKNGDSGSCVFWKDEQNCLHAVGMIVADNKIQDNTSLGESYVTPITAIRDAFDQQGIALGLHTFSSDVSQDYQQNGTEIENVTSVGNSNSSVKSIIDSGATGEGRNGDVSQDCQQKSTEIENGTLNVYDSNSKQSAIDNGATGEGRKEDVSRHEQQISSETSVGNDNNHVKPDVDSQDQRGLNKTRKMFCSIV